MKWMRPTGTEIETNDEPATIEHCVAAGWVEASKPRGRPRKVDSDKETKEAD